MGLIRMEYIITAGSEIAKVYSTTCMPHNLHIEATAVSATAALKGLGYGMDGAARSCLLVLELRR